MNIDVLELGPMANCTYLLTQGKDALSAEFVDAVRQVGRILAEDDVQRAFLEKLTQQQDELKALRNQFRRGNHV